MNQWNWSESLTNQIFELLFNLDIAAFHLDGEHILLVFSLFYHGINMSCLYFFRYHQMFSSYMVSNRCHVGHMDDKLPFHDDDDGSDPGRFLHLLPVLAEFVHANLNLAH